MRSVSAVLLVGSVAMGCATAVPIGARASLAPDYQPYAPAAAPRDVPAATPPPPRAPAEPKVAAVDARRDRVLQVARKLVGKKRVRALNRSRTDCNAVPLAAYEAVGIDLFAAAERGENGVTAIYRYAQQHGRVYQGGRPVAGDLVFFRETYDLNKDGRVNDGLTHVGIVDAVSEDDTVTVIHMVHQGVVRYRMNLAFPDARTHPETGAPINDYLRAPGPNPSSLLTGQLFAAYATVLDGIEQVAAR